MRSPRRPIASHSKHLSSGRICDCGYQGDAVKLVSRPRGRVHYEGLLLDMNGTFMFGGDRFGPNEDFYDTYVRLGGGSLSPEEVRELIRRVYDRMAMDYANPLLLDDFPSVAETLTRFSGATIEDVPILERVFAAHEIGQVPIEFAECLRRLRDDFIIGIVSNIWARKDAWLEHFAEVGIQSLWRTAIFSSERLTEK